jgi:hypothetical protein
VSWSAARNTAKAIAGARLVLLPGAGHDLPEPLFPHRTLRILEQGRAIGPRGSRGVDMLSRCRVDV